MYLGLYEKAIPAELSWEEKLKAAKEAGFDFLELSIDESDMRLERLEWTKSKKQTLLEAIQIIDFPVRTMCLSAHRKFPIGSTDEKTVNRSLDIMQKAINLACDLGIRIIQLAGYDVYYEQSTKETQATFLVNLKKCVEMAAKRGVLLGFETMEVPFMNSVAKAMKYVDIVDSPYLNVYPDVGNITNGVSDVESDLLMGKGNIVAAHLKETIENVFRDMRFGEGRVNFVQAIKTLDTMGVKMFVAEFWHQPGQDYKTELKHTYEFITSRYEKALGLR